MKKIVISTLCLCCTFAFAQRKQNVKQRKTTVQQKKSTNNDLEPARRKSSPSYSSKSSAGAFHFGGKAGGNFTTITGDDKYRNLKSKLGFYGGFFANYEISRNTAVQLEALYQYAGAAITMKQNTNIKGRWELNYIAVPLSFQFKPVPELYLETGPELQINIESKQVVTDRAGDDSVKPEVNFKDATKTLTFGWNIGAGYHISDNIGVNLRYSLGLTTPYKDPENNSTKMTRFKNSNIQLGVFYSF